MKFELKTTQEDETFKPFELTIKFETREEYVRFHDKLVIKGLEGLQDSFFKIGHGRIGYAEGKIDIH